MADGNTTLPFKYELLFTFRCPLMYAFPDKYSSLSISTFPKTFKVSKLPTVFRLLYTTHSARVVFDNISTSWIRYTEPALRFTSLATLIFPDIYTSSWNSAAPTTVTLSKFPTVLRLLYITSVPSVVFDNISTSWIRYTEPALRFTSLATLTFPDTYTSSWNSAAPTTVTLSKFPTVLRLLYITSVPSVVFDNISTSWIRYTDPALRFTSLATLTFPDIYTSSWNSAAPTTVKLSKLPTVLRLLYITSVPSVVFDNTVNPPILITLPDVRLIPKTVKFPLIVPPELLDLLSRIVCKFWISEIVNNELVICELLHLSIPFVKLLICKSKTISFSGALNTHPVPKLFTVINPWLSISLSLICIPLPRAVPSPVEPLLSVSVLSNISKLLLWI